MLKNLISDTSAELDEKALLIALFVIAAQLILFRMIRRLDWLAVLNVKE